MSLNVTNDLGRTPARPTRYRGGYGITDLDRVQAKRVPIDVAAIARWNYAQDRAKDAYYSRGWRKR